MLDLRELPVDRRPGMGSPFRCLSKTDNMRASKNDDRESAMMRMAIIAPFVIAAAFLGETQVSSAQSPYSYPWCSLGGKRGSNALSCYYTSWEQCRTTMSGIGGNCVQSPYYHPQPAQLPHPALVKPRHHRHARTVRASTPGRLE
jgi:hypothetical protein